MTDIANGTDSRGVAVGVDDSEGARRALEWAVEEARVRGCPLTVFHAWYHPSMIAGFEPAAYADPTLLRAQAQAAVEAMVAPWRDKYPELAITVELVDKAPVSALAEASGRADLLVVGSRGRGEFAESVLGSVSRALSHHVHCPLTIVRPPVAERVPH